MGNAPARLRGRSRPPKGRAAAVEEGKDGLFDEELPYYDLLEDPPEQSPLLDNHAVSYDTGRAARENNKKSSKGGKRQVLHRTRSLGYGEIPRMQTNMTHWTQRPIDACLAILRQNLRAERITFLCNICYSNVDAKEMYCLRGGGGCQHKYCRECMDGWLTARIKEGEIINVCPMAGSVEGGCQAEADESDVAEVCSPEVLETYRRFVLLKGPRGHRMVDCPKCKKLAESSGWSSRVKCGNCGHNFCKDHGDAHEGKSCVQFVWEIRKNESGLESNERFIERTTRPCPVCKVPTFKYTGCCHMTCRECARRKVDTHWCWVCGQHIQRGVNGVTEHYSEGACRGKQFAVDAEEDENGYTAERAAPCLFHSMKGVLLVALLGMLVVLALALSPLFLFFFIFVGIPLRYLSNNMEPGFSFTDVSEISKLAALPTICLGVLPIYVVFSALCWLWFILIVVASACLAPFVALYAFFAWLCCSAHDVVRIGVMIEQRWHFIFKMPIFTVHPMLNGVGTVERITQVVVAFVPLTLLALLAAALAAVAVAVAVALLLPVLLFWMGVMVVKYVKKCVTCCGEEE